MPEVSETVSVFGVSHNCHTRQALPAHDGVRGAEYRLRKWLRRPTEWRPPKLSSFARTRPQAARTVSRNLATSAFRRLLSPDSICAADSTCEEAEPVSPAPRSTSAMLAETWWVPCAACCTL